MAERVAHEKTWRDVACEHEKAQKERTGWGQPERVCPKESAPKEKAPKEKGGKQSFYIAPPLRDLEKGLIYLAKKDEIEPVMPGCGNEGPRGPGLPGGGGPKEPSKEPNGGGKERGSKETGGRRESFYTPPVLQGIFKYASISSRHGPKIG